MAVYHEELWGGLDPGSTFFGLGLIERTQQQTVWRVTRPAGKVIDTRARKLCYVASESVDLRSWESPDDVCAVVFQRVHRFLSRRRPSQVVIEEPFLGAHRNVKSALVLASAYGAALAAVGHFRSMRLIRLSNGAIKSTMTGNQHADKGEVGAAVVKLFEEHRAHFSRCVHDELDAVAAACAAAIRQGTS